MAEYTVILADLATGTIRGRYRLGALKYSRVLDGVGSFSGTLYYADRRALAGNPIGSSTLARTVAYVERNESQIMWGGQLWQRLRRSTAPGQADLSGVDFWGTLRRREIQDTLTFTQQDQLDIARDLVRYAQGQALTAAVGHGTYTKSGGNMGITFDTTTSGVLRDRVYEGSAFSNLGEALEQLMVVDRGFDAGIDCAYTAGQGSSITRVLRLHYPRAGRPANQSTLRWEYGNQMTDYTWPEDATGIATTSYALGAGEGASMLRSSASAQFMIDAGYPLLETSRSYKDIIVQATLDAHARADSLVDGVPAMILPSITVRGDVDPEVGAYEVGDEAVIAIDDANFPSGAPAGDLSVNTAFRIHAYEVSVDDLGRESVSVTLGPVLA